MSSLLLLPFADIYDNSLFMWQQRSHHLLLSCICTPCCRHSSRRCSPRCSSLLVSPIRTSEIRMQRNPPSTPEHPASRSVPSPQPPLVLGRLFFFVVSRHTPPSSVSPFSMHILRQYPRYGSLLHTPSRTSHHRPPSLRVLPPNPDYGQRAHALRRTIYSDIGIDVSLACHLIMRYRLFL